jgi:hypothetical protein
MKDQRSEIYERSRAALEGWFEPASYDMFWHIHTKQMAAGLKGDILEIGCYQGQSACTLAAMLQPTERLHLCDLFDLPESKDGHAWRGRPGLCVYLDVPAESRVVDSIEQISGLPAHRIVTHKHSSLDLPTQLPHQKFRIIHVDGRHDRAYVMADLRYAFKAIVPQGVVILDDWRNQAWPEVGTALITFLQRRPSVKMVLNEPHKCYLAHAEGGLDYA